MKATDGYETGQNGQFPKILFDYVRGRFHCFHRLREHGNKPVFRVYGAMNSIVLNWLVLPRFRGFRHSMDEI
jgi:hypothetical protein